MRNLLFAFVKTKAHISCTVLSAAHQHLCFFYIYSTIPLLLKSEIASFSISSLVVLPGLCKTWLETPMTGFLMMWHILFFQNIYILIALALDESIILDVPQFPMENIYQSCDLGRALGRRNDTASQ